MELNEKANVFRESSISHREFLGKEESHEPLDV